MFNWPKQSPIKFLSSILLLLLLSLWIADLTLPLNLPDRDENFAQVVVDRYGRPLRAFADPKGVWRYEINLDEVSPYYLEALLNYEDRWFYSHPGVNPIALWRATWQNLSSQRIVSGGSTLTMQVARILHPHTRTLAGKTTQILRALQLELHFSKQEIIKLYLNYAPFGGTLEGVQAASYAYFDKPAIDLTRAEAALLAVLPQAPSRLRPDRYPERAKNARDKLLDRLLKFSIWSPAKVLAAKDETVAAYTPERPLHAPLLARRLIQEQQNLSRIETTIDLDLQSSIEDLARNYISTFPKHSSAAILVVENETLQVRGYLGSADFKNPVRFGYVDMIKAQRSPGSTLKPFLYALGIDAGLIHSQSLLSDIPRNYSDYRPGNFNEGFIGPVSVATALKRSLNLPAVQLLEHYGPKKFFARLANAGVQLQLPAQVTPNLAIILGGVGISMENLVTGFAAIANGGTANSLRYLQDSDSSPRHFLSSGAAWIIEDMLKANAPPRGVRSRFFANQGQRIAWKTGTSYGFRDAWAIGFNNDYTIGVWLGRPDGTPTPGFYGAVSAAPLLFAVADSLPKLGHKPQPKPTTVSKQHICWPLGTPADKQTDEHCRRKRSAWVLNQVVPRTLPELNEDEWVNNPYTYWLNPDTGQTLTAKCASPQGRQKASVALWPKQLEPWLPRTERRANLIPPTDPSCQHPAATPTGGLEIVGLRDASRLRSANAEQVNPEVALKAIGGRGTRYWFVNGEYKSETQDQQIFMLKMPQAGQYQIAVIDETGNVDKIETTVE